MTANANSDLRPAEHFQKITKDRMFEDEYFFVAQLYDPEWEPTHTI